MSKPWKVKMGQMLKLQNGEPMRVSVLCDPNTTMILMRDVIGKVELPATKRDEFAAALEKAMGAPLMLYEAVTNALHGIYEDEKTLSGAEREKRSQYARRLYRKGMAKIDEADTKYIMDLVEKCYRGSLVSTQVEKLLRNQPVVLVLEEGDELDEPTAVTLEAVK